METVIDTYRNIKILNGFRKENYDVKTSIENLINMIFLYFDGEIEAQENLYFSIENVKEYVYNSGGLKEFDYFS